MAFTVMVIDEELAVLSLSKECLEPLGCEVVEQSDYRRAAAVVQARKLHLVLFGARMQLLDGIELAHDIRRSRRNSGIPIVMLTAGQDTKTIRRGIQEGIRFFLAKPLSRERIVQFFQAMRNAEWEERRRFSRLPLRVNATCRSCFGVLELPTSDISSGGLLLEPSEGLTRCQEIELDLPLPGYYRTVRILATVRHQSSELGVGVKFQDISPDNRRAVESYISGALESQR
jgi:CheY-like chemotaxis protein